MMYDDIYDDDLVGVDGDDDPLVDEEILQAFGLDPHPADFESIVEFAQQGAFALFRSQLTICLRNYERSLSAAPDDYDSLNSFPSQAMTAMKTATDIFRGLTGYDAGVDPNRAIELLERMGYEVIGSSKSVPPDTDNISSVNSSDGTSLAEQ